MSGQFFFTIWYIAVLRIRILRLDFPDPDPVVRCMDPDAAPDLDPSVIKQK